MTTGSGAVTVESVVGTAPLPVAIVAVVVCDTVVVAGGDDVKITAVVDDDDDAVVEAVDLQSLN